MLICRLSGLSRLLLFLVLLSLVNLSIRDSDGQEAAGNFELKDGLAIYEGYINDALYGHLSQHASQLDTFRITSNGGLTAAAKKIHWLLEDHDIELEVDKYCFSACAHYILLVSSNAVLLDNTLIGFHHSDMSLASRFARRKIMDRLTYLETMRPHILADIDFFNQTDVSARMAYIPDILTEPICVGDSYIILDGRQNLYYRNRYDFWTPSYDVLRSLNPNIRTPEDYDFVQIKQAAIEHAPSIANLNFKISNDLEIFEYDESLQKLPFCNPTALRLRLRYPKVPDCCFEEHSMTSDKQ